MKIDWTNHCWTVWDIETGAKLAEAKHIVIRTHCELINTDGNRHGWLITSGHLTQVGDRIIIEEIKNGEG